MTNLQKKVMELIVQNPLASDKKISEMANCSWSQVRMMQTYPEFKEEMTRRLNEQWEQSRKIAQAKMEELAANGNYRACEFILNSVGLGAVQKIEATVDNKIITVDVDD